MTTGLRFSNLFILFHPFSSFFFEKGRKRQKKAEKGREGTPFFPFSSFFFEKGRKRQKKAEKGREGTPFFPFSSFFFEKGRKRQKKAEKGINEEFKKKLKVLRRFSRTFPGENSFVLTCPRVPTGQKSFLTCPRVLTGQKSFPLEKFRKTYGTG